MRVIVILQALVLATVSARAQVGTNQDLLDPNLAETGELTEVPHIDEALASAGSGCTGPFISRRCSPSRTGS